MSIFFLMCSLALAEEEKSKKVMEKDVEELEKLIEGKKEAPHIEQPIQEKQPEISTLQPASKEAEGSFYKSFGKNMVIRGDEKFIYIEAGPSRIVVDSEGRIQVKSAQNISMYSDESIVFQAKKDVKILAGGKVIQEKLEIEEVKKEESKEGPVPAGQPQAMESKGEEQKEPASSTEVLQSSEELGTDEETSQEVPQEVPIEKIESKKVKPDSQK